MYSGFDDFITHYYIILVHPSQYTLAPPNTKLVPTPQFNDIHENSGDMVRVCQVRVYRTDLAVSMAVNEIYD